MIIKIQTKKKIRIQNMLKYVKSMVCVMLLAVTSAWAATNVVTNATAVVDNPEAWVLTLNGSGATTTKNDSQTSAGVEFSLGRTGHLLLPLEAGLRQGISYLSKGDKVIANSKIYADWTLFSIKRLDVFAGGNAGATYGNTKLNWSLAPEAGLRFWLKKDIALIGRVEYPFSIVNNVPTENNVLKYCVGLQMKF